MSRQKWIQVLLTIGIVAIIAFVLLEQPRRPIAHFSMDDLTQVVEQNELRSLHYDRSTGALWGEVQPTAEKRFAGREFRLHGEIPLNTFAKISSARLSSERFLGPVQGLHSEKEFDEALRPQPLQTTKSTFAAGESSVLEVKVMGMTVGEIRATTAEPQRVQNEPCYLFELQLQSSPSFAALYRIEDRASSLVKMANFAPKAFSQRLDESDRYGGVYMIHQDDGHAQVWRKVVTKTQGLHLSHQIEAVYPNENNPVQNLVSALFDLRRRDWRKPQRLRLANPDNPTELIEADFAPAPIETISSLLGNVRAFKLEPVISVGGEKKTSVKVRLWIGEAEPHWLLKIEADLKLGHAVATLKSVNQGHHEHR